jgi:hypothetical protein
LKDDPYQTWVDDLKVIDATAPEGAWGLSPACLTAHKRVLVADTQIACMYQGRRHGTCSSVTRASSRTLSRPLYVVSHLAEKYRSLKVFVDYSDLHTGDAAIPIGQSPSEAPGHAHQCFR